MLLYLNAWCAFQKSALALLSNGIVRCECSFQSPPHDFGGCDDEIPLDFTAIAIVCLFVLFDFKTSRFFYYHCAAGFILLFVSCLWNFEIRCQVFFIHLFFYSFFYLFAFFMIQINSKKGIPLKLNAMVVEKHEHVEKVKTKMGKVRNEDQKNDDNDDDGSYIRSGKVEKSSHTHTKPPATRIDAIQTFAREMFLFVLFLDLHFISAAKLYENTCFFIQQCVIFCVFSKAKIQKYSCFNIFRVKFLKCHCNLWIYWHDA